MAGETIKSPAICLRIHPWSRTSHVVSWLTPNGRILTVVKGAERPKSAFLGQYDLNYTCDILYYARGRGDVRALRECVPAERRDGLRENFRALTLAGWFRHLAEELTPPGPEAEAWYALLSRALDDLMLFSAEQEENATNQGLRELLDFELKVLDLAGLMPDLAEESDGLKLRGERHLPLTPGVAACLRNPRAEKNPKILLDAARAIGVFYSFHLDCAPEARRSVLKVICTN